MSSLDSSYCNSTLAPPGYDEITCPNPNEIVYVNLAKMSWECGVDDERCPGAFHVGCQSDPSPPTTTTTGTTTTGTTTTTTPAPPGVCPDGWIESIEGCFLFQYKGKFFWTFLGVVMWYCVKALKRTHVDNVNVDRNDVVAGGPGCVRDSGWLPGRD